VVGVVWSNEKAAKGRRCRRQMESFSADEKTASQQERSARFGWRRVSLPSVLVLHSQSIVAVIVRRAMGIFDPKRPENGYNTTESIRNHIHSPSLDLGSVAT